jgi:mannose-6-phosphate isomerase-like protein (cupin superfamily)
VTEAETRGVNLVQSVVDWGPDERHRCSAGPSEEVMFVISGTATIEIDGTRHALEPETGVNLGPGQECTIETSSAVRMVAVEIPDPTPPDATPPDATPAPRAPVRRVSDQQAQEATTDREFRIVADPTTGLRSATHFVGYIPTARAPEHFHTYDEVIFVLDGEGVLHTAAGSRPLAAGSEIELPARTIHCLENTGASVMRVVAVFRPAGSPAAAYYPDGTPAHDSAPALDHV